MLMIAAGGMGWLNSLRHFTRMLPTADPLYQYTGDGLCVGWLEVGWPFGFYRVDALFISERFGGLTPDEMKSRFSKLDKRDWLYLEGRGVAVAQKENIKSFLLLNGLLDIAVGLAILILLAVISEWLIRRREGRKR